MSDEKTEIKSRKCSVQSGRLAVSQSRNVRYAFSGRTALTMWQFCHLCSQFLIGRTVCVWARACVCMHVCVRVCARAE